MKKLWGRYKFRIDIVIQSWICMWLKIPKRTWLKVLRNSLFLHNSDKRKLNPLHLVGVAWHTNVARFLSSRLTLKQYRLLGHLDLIHFVTLEVGEHVINFLAQIISKMHLFAGYRVWMPANRFYFFSEHWLLLLLEFDALIFKQVFWREIALSRVLIMFWLANRFLKHVFKFDLLLLLLI